MAAIKAKIMPSNFRKSANNAFITVGVDRDITVASQMQYLRHLNALINADYRKLDVKFYKQSFDLIVADPPHIDVADFLEDFQKKMKETGDPRFLPKIFLVHYGRDFQPNWNGYVLHLLKDGGLWNEVFDVRVGKAKLALCTTRFVVEQSGSAKSSRSAHVVKEDTGNFGDDLKEIFEEFTNSMIRDYHYKQGMVEMKEVP